MKAASFLFLSILACSLLKGQGGNGPVSFPKENGETKNTVVLSESNLPILLINTLGKTIPDEPKITASMQVIDNAGGINNVNDTSYAYDGYIGIEIRGNTAQLYPKKSYTIETRTNSGSNNNVPLLGMPKENDWVLHGPYSDKSLMRNVIAYHVGNAMGRWSPRTAFCEVVINGEYQGVFTFVEKIKRDKNRVDIAKLTPKDTVGDQLTGGYILSIDRHQEGSWISPFMGRTGSVEVPISYVDPKYKELTSHQREYIKEYVTEFEHVLKGVNYKDPINGYRQFIDVESFVDYFIITELSRDLDGYRVSVFFHKDKDSKGGKLTLSPFWDYNLCFGNGDFFEAGETSGWAEEGIGAGDWYEIPFWWDRFRTDPYWETTLKYRWEDLRKGVLDKPTFFGFIDSCALLLEDAQERNFNRFPVLGKYVWPNNYVGETYSDEVQYLKNWISQRMIWLDDQIDAIVPSYERTAINDLEYNRVNVVVYPNPFKDYLTFNLNLAEAGKVQISFTNILGQQLAVYKKDCLAGENQMVIDGEMLNGSDKMLFYTVSINNEPIKTGKVIKE